MLYKQHKLKVHSLRIAVGIVALALLLVSGAGATVNNASASLGAESVESSIPISFGETISGSIDFAGDNETYTFSASAGDAVFIRMSRASGSLWTGIRLYALNGTELKREHGISTAELSYTLLDGGEYKVLAYDSFGGLTGNYSIFIQRLNNPGNASSIGFGETISGFITSDAEMNTYIFYANASDAVLLRTSRGSIRLYATNGTELARNAEISYTLPNDGLYTFLVGTSIGSYNIFLQRLNNLGNVTSIIFGETFLSSINSSAEMDTYTFSANAGDVVFIRMSRASGSLWPGIRLYAANGTELNRESGISTAEVSYILPDNGEYTVLTYDSFGGLTGNYSIFIQRLNNPGNAMLIRFGETTSGTINSVGEMDTYTFYANASNTVLLRTSRGSIRLYATNGTELVRGSEIFYALPDNGVYAVLVETSVGSYNIFLQRLNNPGNAISIVFGETLSGSISLTAEMDTYTFSASAGDAVLIRMSRASGSLWPGIRLYAANGTELNRESGISTAEISYILPDNGEYTVLAYDSFGGLTGNYSIFFKNIQPEILGISPNHGGNAGTATAVINVVNVAPKAVKLVKAGLPQIVGEDVNLTDSTHVGVRFNLTGHNAGIRDLVIQLQDGKEINLTDAFTVEEGGEARLWADIVGREQLRLGRTQRYVVRYGNTGEIDTYDVILDVKLPHDTDFEVEERLPELQGVDWTQVPKGFDDGSSITITIWIYKIAANSENNININVRPKSNAWSNGDNFEITAQLKQRDSVFARTGDLSQIESSATFINVRNVLTQAIQAQGVSINSPELFSRSIGGTLVNLTVDAAFTTLWGVLTVALWEAGANGVIPAWMASTVTLYSTISSARDLFNDLKELYGAAADALFKGIIVQSWDPNDKSGPTGYGTQRFIALDHSLMYQINFENLENATAPAQEIKITDALDPNLDWENFSFNDINVAGNTINIPAGSKELSLTTPMTVYPWEGNPVTENINLKIDASFNSTNGTIDWKLEGRNTTTGELADFLIPNKNPPKGDGWVMFTVKPKNNLQTGTVIKNKASIVFDVNPPMDTPEVFNTIDAEAPSSYVEPVPQNASSFEVRWNGTDGNGSGIRDYTIYISTDNMSHQPWLAHTTNNSATFTGDTNHTYAFYSIARDNVGNIERGIHGGVNYDFNGNGKIDRNEAVTAVLDFFRGSITRQEAVNVVIAFFSPPV